jgi:hypothetical protein
MSRFAIPTTVGAVSFLVTAAAAQITFDDWREAVFSLSELADLACSGPLVDSDGDGANVLQEFFFAGDPILSESFILPRFGLVADHLTLTFRERHDITGVDVRLQGSDTLAHWVTYNSITEADREVFTGFDEVTLIDPVAIAAPPSRRFIRLRLSLDDPQVLRAPERVRISVQSPHVWTVGWTDPNAFETGHAIERLRGLQTWERVGTPGLDQIAWTHTLANYAESFTYRVLAQGEGGAEVASEPYSLPDTDGDGIPDALELGANYTGEPGTYATNPKAFSSSGSDVADGWLVANGFDPLNFDPNADWDGDGIADAMEFYAQTDPREPHPGWVNLDFPSSFIPLLASPSGTALFHDHEYYWMWRDGKMTRLISYHPDGTYLEWSSKARVSDRGDIVISTKHWVIEDPVPDGLNYSEKFEDTLTIYPYDGSPDWSYTPPENIKTSTSQIYNWFERRYEPGLPNKSVGKVFVNMTVAQDGSLWGIRETGVITETVYINNFPYTPGSETGPFISQRPKTSLVRVLSGGFSEIEIYPEGIILRGLDKNSRPIGIAGEGYYDGDKFTIYNSTSWSSFVDLATVDYEPVANTHSGRILGLNRVTGTTAVYELDGTMTTVPQGTYFWDDRERPSKSTYNYVTGQWRNYTLTPTREGGAWRELEYEPVELPESWISDHRVPVGSSAAQLGLLSTDEGERRPFLKIANPAKLLVDSNHDGIIEAAPTWQNDLTTPTRPLWLHINDNDDNPGEETEADYLNSVVDGPDDLDDFIPVVLDIKQLLGVLPHTTQGITYKLKHADGALNIVYTSLTRAAAFSYLTDTASTYGPSAEQSAAAAITERITSDGIPLNTNFLTRIKDQDQGVILVEFRGLTASPLRLVVEKAGTEIAEVALSLVALARAPDVLKVNADFDEQKLAGSPQIAQADSADEDLRAARGPRAGQIITDDLYPGFFGLHPLTLPASFYDGAVVTIEKVAALDPETGKMETGDLRLHAISGSGAHTVVPITRPLPSGGTTAPVNLVPLLYTASPVVPRDSNSQFWIEGIKAGPITLRLHFQRGAYSFAHDQRFLVATHQSKAEWQEEIRQHILLQTSGTVDFAAYGPPVMSSTLPFGAAPFMPNRRYLQQVYSYYEYLYVQRPTLFYWPGLGKMAGGPVYAGMVDAEHGRTALPSWLSTPTLLANEAGDFFQGTLMVGNYDIFDDLAWQFRAYQTSGIWALRYVDAAGVGDSTARAFEVQHWEKMWLGEHTGSATTILAANFDLTNREQEHIVQPAWNIFLTRGWVGLEYLLGIVSESPLKSVVAGADGFTTVAGFSRDIRLFADRWIWITDAADGIWQDWTTMPAGAMTSAVTTGLWPRSETFSRFYQFLGTPIIW